jgi:hypothetical protein
MAQVGKRRASRRAYATLRLPYLVSIGSGFTLSFGGPACMVISVIETRS